MKHSTPHNVLNACRSATATLTLAQADWFHFHVIFTHSSGNSDWCLWLCFHSLSAGVLRQSTCQLFPLPCQQIVKGSELSCTTYQQSKKTPQNPTMSSPYCTLQSLHWLPVRAQIQYKISTIWFNVIMHTKPLWASPSTGTLQLEIFAFPQIPTCTLEILYSTSSSKTLGHRSFSCTTHLPYKYFLVFTIPSLRHHFDRPGLSLNTSLLEKLLLFFPLRSYCFPLSPIPLTYIVQGCMYVWRGVCHCQCGCADVSIDYSDLLLSAPSVVLFFESR